MKLRKIIFWLHLLAGVITGVIILVMSATGVLLAYERQLSAWADGYSCAPAQAGATRLSLEALLAKACASQTDAPPSTITLSADSTAAVAFGFGREQIVFVHPYTGAVLGEGSPRFRAFFHRMTDWHRWLGTNEQGRAVGRAITGACNLAFLVLVVSGFYLWWPRNWTRNALRPSVWFVAGLRGKRRDWNWHNVIGLWCALPLFFIVLAGVIMSYSWANNLLYRLTGSEPPPPRQGPGFGPGPGQNSGGWPGREREHDAKSNPPPSFSGLDQLCATAGQLVTGWRTITIRLPASPKQPVAFTLDTGSGGRPDLRSQFTLDLKTGEVLTRETFSSYNLGRKLRMWARFVHTGEAGSFLGQTIAMLASAGGVLLVWTGLALAWRRFFGGKGRTSEMEGV